METGLDAWLRRWRRQFARWLLREQGSRVAAGALGALVAALAADAAFALPVEARWAVWGAGFAGLVWALERRLLSPWRGLEPRALLRAAERRWPGLSSFLVSAWELRRGVPPGTSEALAAEHRARADRVLAGARILEPLYPCALSSGARRALWASGIWSVVAGAWLLNASPGVERVLAPWRERPLDELVAVAPGSARVPWGDAVELSARWREGRRERLGLWLRTGAGSLAEVPWDVEDRGGVTFRIPQLNGPAEYQVRWRGQRSRRYRLEPVPRPQLTGAKLRVYPPGRQTGGFQDIPLEGAGEVAALRGSWIVASGTPNVALAGAALRVSFLPVPVEMRRASDGSWEGAFPLREDGRLEFELASEESMTDPSPVAYSLRALADEPPRVDLLSPAFEAEASPRDRLPISYHAADDFGLASLSLVYRIQGPGGAVERSAPLPKPRPGKEAYGDFAWDLSGLPIGARVEFQVRAEDNASPSPQAGLSQKGYVHIADFDRLHAQAERQWLGLEDALAKLAEKEGRMKFLSGDAAKDAAVAEVEREQREALDRELLADWREAAQEAQEFAGAMAKDAYANPGVAAQAQGLAWAIQEAASSESPAASSAMRNGDFSEAERRHGRLENRARAAGRRLAEARQMQGLQDFWNEADRLDQAGGDLSKALSEMAEGRKPSAEEAKRLQEALGKLQKAMEDLAKSIAALPKAPEGSEKDKSRKTYEVPLGQALRTADALQRALAAGDYAAAARIAQRLADQLSRVRQAVGDAARDQAAGMGGGEDPLSGKLEAAAAAWDEVIQDQTGSLGLAQKLEDQKTKELLERQDKLLDELRAKQAEAVRRGEALGPRLPPDALLRMRATLSEFEKKAVSRAPEHLRWVIDRLRSQAAADAGRGALTQGAAADLQDLAAREAEILAALAAGADPPPPTEARRSGSLAARRAQARVREETVALQRRLEELASEAGGLPGSIMDPLGAAQKEQSAAESSLSQADSARAVGHEQGALDELEKGRKALGDAIERQMSIEQGLRSSMGSSRGGVRRAGSGGRTGVDTSFVPLPSAKDYEPPRELRRELERSSRERRPSAYDPVIKEYLRRMSE